MYSGMLSLKNPLLGAAIHRVLSLKDLAVIT